MLCARCRPRAGAAAPQGGARRAPSRSTRSGSAPSAPTPFPAAAYAIAYGEAQFGSEPLRHHPVRGRGVGGKTGETSAIAVCVNRTPVAARMSTAPRQERRRPVRLRACATPSPRRPRARTSPSGSTSRRPTCRSPRTARSRTSRRSCDAIADAIGKAIRKVRRPGAGGRVAEGRRARPSRRGHRRPSAAARSATASMPASCSTRLRPIVDGGDRAGTEDRQLHRHHHRLRGRATAKSR